MAKPVLDEVGLMAAIEALKSVSPEEQEAAILALEEEHPGVGQRASALLELEKQTAEAIRKAEADGRRMVAEAKARVGKPDVEPTKPVVQPVAKIGVVGVGEGWRFVQRADGTKWRVRGTDWRRWFGPVPKTAEPQVVLRTVEQAKPEPEPEPEEPELEEKPRRGGLVLKPDAPWDNASAYVAEHCLHHGVLSLHFWKKQWWRWDGPHYKNISEEEIKHRLWDFLAEGRKRVGDGLVAFRPLPSHVSGLFEALKAGVFLTEAAEPPRWLKRAAKGGVDLGEEAPNIIAFKNGLVDIETGQFKEHSVSFWNHHCLGFDYNPAAKAERWEQYLHEVLPDDEEGQNFLEEFGGYCMGWKNKFHKAALLHGKPRAGKGTYAWTMEQMVGATAYTALNINTWASGENSAANIIGKKVLCFPDVRLKPGKQYGENWDPGGLDQKSIGMMLMITGGDRLPVGIKYDKFKWEGHVLGKIIYISNEIPTFNDPSGALPERFIGVEFPRNLEEEGVRDPDLQSKLVPELSGIANRMMEGYRRLMSRGHFIEPKAGRIIRAKVNAKTEPELAFFDACLAFDVGDTIPQWVLWPAWEYWCRKMGQHRLLNSITTGFQVARVLGDKVPGWTGAQAPRPHGSERRYLGVRLRDDPELLVAIRAWGKEKRKEW
jgi:putative DNA primase/helicase